MGIGKLSVHSALVTEYVTYGGLATAVMVISVS